MSKSWCFLMVRRTNLFDLVDSSICHSVLYFAEHTLTIESEKLIFSDGPHAYVNLSQLCLR